MPSYKRLRQKNPDWDGLYWRRCRALYAGGKKLLCDRAVMQDVFPPHLAENAAVYTERSRRAFYIPYAGEIIDMITSALFSEDLKMQGDPDPDEWYTDWVKDVSPPGGTKQTLQQFLKEQVTTALLTKRAWTLVDLPSINDSLYGVYGTNQGHDVPTMPGSLAEQEKLGLLNAYACPLDPECVWDWECARDGRLLWVLIHYASQRRDGIEADRDAITEQWMYYTPTSWERYEITYKASAPPQDGTDVPKVDGGSHSFGEVPVIRLELTDGLWAMGKIESIAVAHMNKLNALTWAQYKSLFPVLTHFAGPPDATNPITEDPDRALNQTVGQGYIFQLGHQDKLEFIGPPTEAFSTAADDLKTLRDEMHRVVHQMAMSVDNSAAALQRSAKSKQVDQSSTAVVLREFGKLVRAHAIELFEMAQRGRQDPQEVEWSCIGMDGYNDVTVDSIVTQAQTLEVVTIPSATFQQRWKSQVARKVLGDSCPEDVMERIDQELEANITNEQFQQQPAPLMAPGTDTDPSQEQPQQLAAGAQPQVGADGNPVPPTGGQVGVTKEGKVKDADGTQPGDTSQESMEEVLDQLKSDFPPDAMEWIHEATWKGPVRVSLSQIDFSNSDNWRAAHEPDKVDKFVDKIGKGWEKPIILVKRPGMNKLMVVDGHHRALAYLHHEKSALAYVGTVDQVNGPWDEMHDDQKGNPPPGTPIGGGSGPLPPGTGKPAPGQDGTPNVKGSRGKLINKAPIDKAKKDKAPKNKAPTNRAPVPVVAHSRTRPAGR